MISEFMGIERADKAKLMAPLVHQLS